MSEPNEQIQPKNPVDDTEVDLEAEFHSSNVQEVLDKLAEPVSKFFITKTKAELLEGALKFNAQLYPVADASDIAANPQLAAREYWVELEHAELNDTITYPGAFGKTTEAQPRLSRRAPLIGEHNREIYEEELGISVEKLDSLKETGII